VTDCLELRIEIWKDWMVEWRGSERQEKNEWRRSSKAIYRQAPKRFVFFFSLFLLDKKNCEKSNQICCFDSKFVALVTTQMKQVRGRQKSDGSPCRQRWEHTLFFFFSQIISQNFDKSILNQSPFTQDPVLNFFFLENVLLTFILIKTKERKIRSRKEGQHSWFTPYF